MTGSDKDSIRDNDAKKKFQSSLAHRQDVEVKTFTLDVCGGSVKTSKKMTQIETSNRSGKS